MTDFINRFLGFTIQIQQIPAPTFEESRRAEFVRAKFIEEGLADISRDEMNNVYARLAGKGRAAPLIVSAHMDTVFPAATNLEVRKEADKIFGPGIGDNSLGVAALFGLLWKLRERKAELDGDVWLVANTGEEGLGDLRGMRAVVDRFGNQVKAYLIVEGMALGHVYHRAIGVRRYHITVRTAGGHSWSDYGQPSAVHELARLMTQITALHLPSTPRTTLNVGVIGGGTTVNTLAAEAWMDLDLRSEDSNTLAILTEQIEKLIASANRDGISVESKVTSQRPSGEITPSHPLIHLAMDCVREQGLDINLTSGSTDANIPLSRGIPALVLGVTLGGGAHTTHEFIDTRYVSQGMEQLVNFVSKVWK
ncbi:MAG TPA: M20/M25/M40 family metallo-hydrolase [Anaerolineales bacterium]|nr:M20/M25/M40 family metallo-hydrolase [Anaerolineales bacterium]